MSKLGHFVGVVWSGPLTLIGLAYVTLFTALGWYRHLGWKGDANVWYLVPDKMPKWLTKAWARWNGHTVGQVVVLRNDIGSDRGKLTLRHEQQHVWQCMRLGIFQPIFYYVSYVAIKLACPNSDAYYSNPFEIDSRRAAGQVVDVEGALKKLAEQTQQK